MYCHIQPATVVTVPTHKDLRTAWSLFGHTCLVKAFVCETSLTKTQLRRLPKRLREALTTA